MNRLERTGIFKCRPVTWKVQTSGTSKSVGINFEFLVLSELGEEPNPSGEGVVPVWMSWENYDEHVVYGTFWVIGKLGKVNQDGVDQLVKSIGWNGDLGSVGGSPPDVVCQVTVKAEDWKGVPQYKASWLNPEDYVPGPGGASREEVTQLTSQYGSLLRAAAAGAKKAAGGGAPKPAAPKPAAPAPKQSAPPPTPDFPAPAPADDIPFREPGDDDASPVGPFVRADALKRVLDPANREHLKTALADLKVTASTPAAIRALDDATLEKVDEKVFDLAIPL